MPIVFQNITPTPNGTAALSFQPLQMVAGDTAGYAASALRFSALTVSGTGPSFGTATLSLQPLTVLATNAASFAQATLAFQPMTMTADSQAAEVPYYAVADIVMPPMNMWGQMVNVNDGQAVMAFRPLLMMAADHAYAETDTDFMRFQPLTAFGLDAVPLGDFILDGGFAILVQRPIAGDAATFTDGGSALKVVFAEETEDVLTYEDGGSPIHIIAAVTTDGSTLVITDEGASPLADPYEVWSINAETFAASRYQNFRFNSFARIGGRYFGANDTGIYELVGYTDAPDEAEIAAYIRSGKTDLGTSRLKRIPRVYVRGESDGYLTLCVQKPDGQIRSYPTRKRLGEEPTQSRADPAKGLEMVFWQFELRNQIGQDFKLIDVEFKLSQMQRRVV